MSKKEVLIVVFGFLIAADIQAITLEGGYYKAMEEIDDPGPRPPLLYMNPVPYTRIKTASQEAYVVTESSTEKLETGSNLNKEPSFRKMEARSSHQDIATGSSREAQKKRSNLHKTLSFQEIEASSNPQEAPKYPAGHFR
jgi:hypothetical protein